MLFCAFPFVFEEARGWSEGQNGLAFLGILVGLVLGMAWNTVEHARYTRLMARVGNPEPEARLSPMMVGAISLPLGLFWFAWTTYPSVHFLAPIAGTVLFGVGTVLVFVSIKTYLVDCYIVFAASAIGPTIIVRSIIAAAFPLFTPAMFHNLGLQWGASIPAFLSLLCMPFPFIFHRYGPAIRARCRFSKEAVAFLERRRTTGQDLSSSQMEQSPDEAVLGGVLGNGESVSEHDEKDCAEKGK
jgi:hypothetical protein